jgi:uncharacterized membrane protein
MEKMIQVLCASETDAFKVLQALQQLSSTRDIAIGETYVITKDENGNATLRSAKDKTEGYGALSGGLLGGLIGMLAGPLGLIVGVAGGLLAGSASETLQAEDVSYYLDQVSANIPNGKSIVIAHLWEDWEAPVDEALSTFSTEIKRFNVMEEIFVPAKTDLEKVNEDIKEAENRFLEAEGSEKAEWNMTLTALRNKRDALQHKLDTHADFQEKQYETWLNNNIDTDDPNENRKNLFESRARQYQTMLNQFRRTK